MKFLHTADWHIGQLFHEFDRAFEHQQFLNWLVQIIKDQEIDVLLISGDVFDLSNPSASSIKMFYTFLNNAVKANPEIQIIITAGNHDSATRLESPKPLLESSNIHIVGVIERDENGLIDYAKVIIQIKDQSGSIKAWCIAAPFLRIGDYPVIPDCNNPYAEGVAAFYKEAYEHIAAQKQAGQAIIAMGHLHAQQAEIGEIDKMERLIMGGIECISAASFPEEIAYVALGHIHKAQRIGGKEHIRYSGSPLPMSFSERNYKHQVITFEIENERVKNIQGIEIPMAVSVLSKPAKHAPIEEVIMELNKLPDAGENREISPYLEVRVLEDKPDPARRHKIEQAIQGKHVRLATINVKAPTTISTEQVNTDEQQKLDELNPVDVFSKIYTYTYGNPVPADMLQLFNQVTQEVAQTSDI
ncbi:MAG: exonuclease SbcCD subunit D C-terminal domain-containing protein [Sporocytophaga sp.]|nr:exonuclease SbcCD subunit D C-terminal domain-containing protein [Sporocytophaga sp.]